MYRVRHQHVKFWPRDVAWRREIDLPESLFDKPLLGGAFRNLSGFSQFFNGREAFPVALITVVDFAQLGIHYFTSAEL